MAVAGKSFSKLKFSYSLINLWTAKLFHLRDIFPNRIRSENLNRRNGCCRYVRNEREIGDGQLVANKVFLLGENTLEDTQNTDDLLLVSFDGRWDLLSVVHAEPRCLAVVRSDVKQNHLRSAGGTIDAKEN